MRQLRVVVLTVTAMLAFAGNSLLCRAALTHTSIDAASFTSIRIVAGAATLWLLVRLRRGTQTPSGSWACGLALFVSAAAFSFAYAGLTAGTGALLLFGAVQATMIGAGWRGGERLCGRQVTGVVLALCGLVALVLPGVSGPPLRDSALMLTAGVAWGVYSVLGKAVGKGKGKGKGKGVGVGVGDPLRATAGNFLRAVAFTAVLSLALWPSASLDRVGIGYAIASGALASGVGYAIWYAALADMKVTNAATVQLSVPVIAALGGVTLLGEPLTLRLSVASITILSGIALVIAKGSRRR